MHLLSCEQGHARIAHLPEPLVDDPKFECVVHLMFIISHYQLGSLNTNKQTNKRPLLSASSYYLNCF